MRANNADPAFMSQDFKLDLVMVIIIISLLASSIYTFLLSMVSIWLEMVEVLADRLRIGYWGERKEAM